MVDQTTKMRLDLFLTKKKYAQSRNKALELIKSNSVRVDNKIATKASIIVDNSTDIQILCKPQYVSRSANKLKFFLDGLDIDIANKVCLDIGSSTGGFTQVLLELNIKNISCVDVGTSQLHSTISQNNRVTVYENCDIRAFNSQVKFDLIVCDVSFISIHNILNDIDRLSKSEIIILFKPQYEVGKEIKRDKNGIIKDKDSINSAINRFKQATNGLKWQLIKFENSKVKGKNGNEEFFFYFKK